MMEIMVFALVFVMAQVAAGLIMTYVAIKLMTNKKFIIKYTKYVMETMEEVTEELEKELEKKGVI